MKVKVLSRVQLLATPRTAAYQAPLSMGFSRQEYWSGVPLPSPVLLSAISQIPVELYGSTDGKESACNAGNLGLIPGLERSPGEVPGNPL